jgi:quinol monooxygenase YgiN
MILSLIRLLPAAEKRQAMIDILRSMESLSRVKPGCESCCIYEQIDETRAVLYIEQWQTTEALQRHVQSSMYMRLLTAMELCSEAPEIQFHEVSKTEGLEFIEKARAEGEG